MGCTAQPAQAPLDLSSIILEQVGLTGREREREREVCLSVSAALTAPFACFFSLACLAFYFLLILQNNIRESKWASVEDKEVRGRMKCIKSHLAPLFISCCFSPSKLDELL